jgi:hypothetical protein
MNQAVPFTLQCRRNRVDDSLTVFLSGDHDRGLLKHFAMSGLQGLSGGLSLAARAKFMPRAIEGHASQRDFAT